MPTIPILFNQGIQAPAKLDERIVKPTAKGKLSYARNVEIQNDEYGNGVLVPGPAMTTLTNNSELTGVPYVKQFYGDASVHYIYFAEGINGATNKIRRVTNVVSGSTPQIDTVNATVTHSGHSNVAVDDLTIRYLNVADPAPRIYVAVKDATDQSVQKFDPTISGSITLSTVNTVTLGASTLEFKLLTGPDNNIYLGRREFIGKIDTSDVYTDVVLTLPGGFGVSALAEWNNRMVIAYNTLTPFTFAQRNNNGGSGAVLWDYTSSSFQSVIRCNSRYISALVNDPDGSLLAFGGVDEGKTTIYQFNGFSFVPLYSYIGDMPRNRHSVDFDALGRVLWLTPDGQICRYDKRSQVFDYLATMPNTGGGVFSRMLGGVDSSQVGSANNAFLSASGASSTYFAKRMSFGTYQGDGADVNDSITTTPMAITGFVSVPPRSLVEHVDITLKKNLESGEKIEIRLHKNGSIAKVLLGSLDFSVDGSRAAKRIYLHKYNIDSLALGFVWKTADAMTYNSGIVSASLTYKPLR